MVSDRLINCVLVAAGKYHDIDFARSELLQLLGQHSNIRTRVFEHYEDKQAIQQADLLISYTCDIVPSPPAQQTLHDWIEQGGRWLALHGTNSILRLMDDGLWHTPREAPVFMELLGSQFLSHPPIQPYTIENTAPHHPLTQGIASFETSDELYHLEVHEPIERLLEAECTAAGRGFAEGDDAPGRHPVFYRKTHGSGELLYCTLGHCRGHFDMRPLQDYWPTLDRGAWETPEYRTIIDRSLNWLVAADKNI